MKERVLVVGATGMLGQPVARRLLADGWDVRCLVRDVSSARQMLGDEFAFARADVTQPETLDAAFEGCAMLHLNLRGTTTLESYQRQEVQGAAHCIAAARRHGMRRISYLSGSGDTEPRLRHYFPVQVKLSVEAALANSGLPWTAFRATHFMESLPLFVRNGRANILGRQPHRLHYVAAQDYSRMVSRALDLPAAANRALTIWGPDAFTMREALHRYVAAKYPQLSVGTLPLPIARVIARLSGNGELEFACKLFEAFAAIGEAGDPSEANQLLGAPETTLDQWLREMGS